VQLMTILSQGWNFRVVCWPTAGIRADFAPRRFTWIKRLGLLLNPSGTRANLPRFAWPPGVKRNKKPRGAAAALRSGNTGHGKIHHLRQRYGNGSRQGSPWGTDLCSAALKHLARSSRLE